MPLSKRLILAGAGVYAIGTAAAYSILKPATEPQQEQDSATFDGLAAEYDAKVNFEETFMGLKLLRWWLVSQAQGNVLEISAGTGRNLGYYNWKALTSLTLTDSSRHMLFYARQKLDDSGQQVPVHFVQADAQQLRSLQPSGTQSSTAPPSAEAACTAQQRSERLPQTGFDTVVDSFGLCSHSSPVEALKEASSMCKPGGKLLLLEHGKAKYDWLNSILDRDADKHRRKWACSWNRDIEAIVKAAGLTIDSMQRWHFGTTYVIIAQAGKPSDPQAGRQ